MDLWAIDEVHFQQHGSRCRMWVPPEDRDPICLHHPTRKSIGFFGAVRLRDGRLFTRREEGKFNAQSFWDFLRALRKVSHQAGRRVVLISDNAKYHHGLLHQQWRAELAVKGFELNFLPPYSPELNPIERVWKLTRRLCFHNQYFPELSMVVDAAEDQFREWSQPNETLRRLVSIL